MEPHIIPPNLNGKVYREFFPSQNKINTFLDFIDISGENVILGTSNLNGRYWDGSICSYKYSDSDSTFNVNNPTATECLDVGVTDGKLLTNTNKVVIAQDSGQLKMFQIEDNNLKLLKYDFEEHDDSVTEISLWSDNSFVTCSVDSCIKLWTFSENEGVSCSHTYNYGHTHLISSISTNKNDENLFVSCSYDRTALLWDKRTKEIGTVSVFYENEFCALTRVEWHPTKSNLVAISNSGGDVYLVDVREPKEFVAKKSCFNRSVHRTRFNSQGLLAVCADDSKTIVLDCANDDMKIAYIDDRHTDFVRGLTWKDNILFSCAWDKQVLLHYL